MNCKAMKAIFMIVTVLVVLVLVGLPQAQSRELKLGNLQQLAALNVKTAAQSGNNAAALATGECLLTAANDNLSKLTACGNDSVCTATVLLDTILEILTCNDPNNKNLALFACVSDALVNVEEIKATCAGDNTCALQKILPVVLNLGTCLKQGNGTPAN